MKIKIEKGVPIPDDIPWGDIEVEESFLIPSKYAGSARSCAVYHGKRLNRKFKSKKEGLNVRFWRVE